MEQPRVDMEPDVREISSVTDESESGSAALRRMTLLLPAFNEEAGLAAVLGKVQAAQLDGLDILVVDDGSTDGTADVAQRAGVRLTRHPRNLGKGAAMRTGLSQTDRPVVLLMDADDTYPVDAIPKMAQLMETHDYVVGVRDVGREHIPRVNRWGNAILAALITLVAGRPMKDPLTGLYGLYADAMRSMDLVSDGFAIETEIAVKASWMDLKMAEIPIQYGERMGETKLEPIRDGIAIAMRLARLAWAGISLGMLVIAAAALGLCLLFAGYVAELPRGPVARPAPGDLRWAPVIIAGLGLLVLAAFFGGIDAVLRERSRHRRQAGRLITGALATVLAALVGLGVAVSQAGNLLDPGRPTPPLAIALIIGALLAPVALPIVLGVLRGARPASEAVTDRPGRRELLAVTGLTLGFAAIVIIGILAMAPFSWDEASYALTSRHWVLGTPDTGWGPHRPPILPALGTVAAAVGGNDTAFRMITLVLSAGTVVAAWWVGRIIAGPVAGLVAMVGVAVASPMQIDAGLFLNDIPSVGIFLMLVAALWHIMERPGPLTRSFLWLAPLAALAFYLRYGVIVALVALAVTSALLWPRKLLQGWRWVVATMGAFLVLLLPHFVFAIQERGSPFAVMTSAADAASGSFPGEALVTYAAWLPSRLVGPGSAVVALIGLFAFAYWLAQSLARRAWSRPARAMVLLVLPSLVQIVVLGFAILPQHRYLFPAMTCLIVAGAVTIGGLWQRLSGMRVTVALAGTALIAVALATSAVTLPAAASGRSLTYSWIRAAAEQIAAASGESCAVLATPVPQITWYSGCSAYGFGGIGRGCERGMVGEDRWLLVRRDGRFQATPDVMADCVARAVGPPIPVRNSAGGIKAHLYRLGP